MFLTGGFGMTKRAWIFGLLLVALCGGGANAQAIFVTTCGTVPAGVANPVAGHQAPTFVDTTGKLCVNATATITFETFDAAFPAAGLAIGLNDGANLKAWMAAIALGDGVNGNDTGAMAPWLWNGTSYDRWYGDKTSGGWVNVKAAVPALGITPTDRTITSATGASQQMMAANAARHSLLIENTGNANCGVNPTGGTAAIGGAGTLTLVPNGSYQPRVPTLTAVTVICAAAQPIYGEEN